jgi:hypothetical protein
VLHSNHLRKLFVARCTCRRLRVITRCSSINLSVFGRDQLRPDGLPVFRAQHLARNAPLRDLLDTRTVLNRHFAIGRLPLVDSPLADAELIGERLVTADDACGDLDRVFVHCLVPV